MSEVAVKIHLGRSDEFPGGQPRGVRSGISKVKHEWLVVLSLCVIFDDGNRFGGEARGDFFKFEIGSDSTSAPKFSLNGRPASGVVGRDLVGGWHDRFVSTDVEVRRDVGRGSDPEEGVEPAIGRTTAQGAFKLRVFKKPEMPFPDHRGVVACFLQHPGKGQAVFVDDRVVSPADRLTKRISSGHESVSGQMAEWAGSVCIGELDPVSGQFVDMGRGNLGRRIVATRIPVSHIIGEDDDNVGVAGVKGSAGANESEQKAFDNHYWDSLGSVAERSKSLRIKRAPRLR